ncbi:MAG: hypothetical protein AB1432_03370 [Bacteroidota bacterium]
MNKALRVDRHYDKLKLENGTDLFISHISRIISFSDSSLLILDGKKREIFIINKDFKIQSKINFQNNEYFFNGRIRDIYFLGSKLFMVDESCLIKIYDLFSGELNKVKINDSQNWKSSTFPNNLIITLDMEIISSLFPVKLALQDSVVLGYKMDQNGNVITIYKVDLKSLDYNDFFIKYQERPYLEKSFISKIDENKIIFCTQYSRKAFIFNTNGILEKTFDLKVSESEWAEPHKDKLGFFAYPVNRSPLEVENGIVFQVVREGNNKNPRIVEYNITLSTNRIYQIEQYIYGWGFLLAKNGSNFILCNDEEPIIYILKYF